MRQAPIPDTIHDSLLSLGSGVYFLLKKEVPPRIRLKQIQTPIAKKWIGLGDCFGRIRGMTADAKTNQNSTGR